MVAECFRCGAFGENVILFDAISKGGVVQVCEKCSVQESIPVIKRPTRFQLKAAETPYSVYSRLSRMAGLNPEEHKRKVIGENLERGRNVRGQEASLREIIDKTYEKKFEQKKQERDDLVPNFHWVAQRARRLRKLTQEQVAKEIDEPVDSIIAVERGVVPENRSLLIGKLETFFRIKLDKDTQLPTKKIETHVPEKQKLNPEDLKFDKNSSKKITIADIKEIKKDLDSKSFSRNVEKEELEEGISFEEED